MKPKSRHQASPNFFRRLEERGIDYAQVKRIVQFEFPHEMLRFSQWFPGRTCKEVFDQLHEWKSLLKNDFVLSLSGDLKLQVEKFIHILDWQLLRTLIEANPHIGPWQLQIRFLPTDWDESGGPRYIHPDWEVLVVNQNTKETRTERIPGAVIRNPLSAAEALRGALQNLGVWKNLLESGVRQRLTSKHEKSGWPIWTKFVIPRLYEFLLPFYKQPGHYSDKRDRGTHLARSSIYPRLLLEEMLQILRQEHPWVFSETTTTSQLKAVIQRHRDRKSQQRT